MLAGILRFDDAVAKAMYSPTRLVPTYAKSEITHLPVTYNGGPPDPSYIPGWRLTLKGLRSGGTETLTIGDLQQRFAIRDQITRLVCVDGWSAVAWWGGFGFRELMEAYPPADGMKWAALVSSVGTDGFGHSQPYFVSIDLDTARHPQTLLATQHDGLPLTVEHGAPLRLLAPMKLGLKNIKAITGITYTVEEPQDYWGNLGFSHYDGI
jgi:DMSO/TMAO reductase YedYZ molybdopterin-dependent catalytic subunit